MQRLYTPEILTVRALTEPYGSRTENSVSIAIKIEA